MLTRFLPWACSILAHEACGLGTALQKQLLAQAGSVLKWAWRLPKATCSKQAQSFHYLLWGTQLLSGACQALCSDVWLLRNPDKRSGCWRKHRAPTRCRGNGSGLWLLLIAQIWSAPAVCCANGRMSSSADCSKPLSLLGAAEEKREGNFKNNICLIWRSCSHS